MTNFQSTSSSRQRLITPERAVFILPIFAGALLSLLLALFALPPLVIQLNERRTRVAEMERKRDELPLLRKQLELLLQSREKLQVQQNGLLNLVAGREALKTWLTTLNRLAATLGVSIIQIEPQPVEVYVSPTPVQDGTSPPAPVRTPSDPLLASSVEKHSAIVTLKAPFQDLVSLLRQTELLQVIVIASDLEMQPAPQATTTKRLETILKLRFSTYGRTRSFSSIKRNDG